MASIYTSRQRSGAIPKVEISGVPSRSALWDEERLKNKGRKITKSHPSLPGLLWSWRKSLTWKSVSVVLLCRQRWARQGRIWPFELRFRVSPGPCLPEWPSSSCRFLSCSGYGRPSPTTRTLSKRRTNPPAKDHSSHGAWAPVISFSWRFFFLFSFDPFFGGL